MGNEKNITQLWFHDFNYFLFNYWCKNMCFFRSHFKTETEKNCITNVFEEKHFLTQGQEKSETKMMADYIIHILF